MKLVHKYIDKAMNGCVFAKTDNLFVFLSNQRMFICVFFFRSVTLVAEDPEDMWYVFFGSRNIPMF